MAMAAPAADDEKVTNDQIEGEEPVTSEKFQKEVEIQKGKVHKDLDQIVKTFEGDRNFTNAIEQYSELLTMNPPDTMNGVMDAIKQTKSTWDKVMKDEKDITAQVGEKAMSDLKDVRRRYFLLLLETRSVIKDVIQQCDHYREDLDDLLEAAAEAMKNGNKIQDDDEAEIFNEQLQGVMGWIDETKIQKLVEQWSLLSKDLEVQKGVFEKAAESMDKLNPKAKWMLGIASGLAVVGGVALGLFFCITHPVGWGIMLGLAITAAVGAVVLVLMAKGRAQRDSEIVKRIKEITAMLEQWIKVSNQAQSSLKEMTDDQQNMAGSIKRIRTRKGWKQIERALKKIGNHFDEFEKHGKKTMAEIEKACVEFITK